MQEVPEPPEAIAGTVPVKPPEHTHPAQTSYRGPRIHETAAEPRIEVEEKTAGHAVQTWRIGASRFIHGASMTT